MGACAVLWEIHLVVTRRTIRDNVGTHHHAGMSWECTTEISSKLFCAAHSHEWSLETERQEPQL